MIITLILVILVSILTIASNSISIQCYNTNKDYKNSHPHSFKFTIFCLVLSILILIGGFIKIYIDVESDGAV